MSSTRTLADLVNKRLRCLAQLLDVGQQQAEFIAQGEITPVLRLLSAKSQLITALQAIEKLLAPFHGEDPDARVWESPAARAACAAEAEECRTLLARVMELEARNEAAMTERRDAVGQQLQSFNAASRARSAYLAASHARSTGGVPAPHVPLSTPAPAAGLDAQSPV